MMIRAAKHNCRKLIPKAFRALKKLVRPEIEIMPTRIIQLKTVSLQRWRQFIIQRRVSQYQKLKAIKQYKVFSLQKTLKILRIKTRQLIEKRFKYYRILEAYNQKKNRTVISNVIKALKQRAYTSRVYKYLISLHNSSIRMTYFNRLKDSFLASHTETYKYRKAIQHHTFQILAKTLTALWDYGRRRFIQRVKGMRGIERYQLGVLRRGLGALWDQRCRSIEKRNRIIAAQIEHSKEKLQKILIKLVSVGIYWAQIKGRFTIGKHSRIYLGLKYGMRWRARALMRRFKVKGNDQPIEKLGQVEKNVTDIVQRILQPLQQPNKMITIPRKNVNNMISDQTQRTGGFPNISSELRISEIEREITNFKQKKMLLKELEDQFSHMQNNQAAPMVQLLLSKINTLRAELIDSQPKIKVLLQEISSIKNGTQTSQRSVKMMNSPALSIASSQQT